MWNKRNAVLAACLATSSAWADEAPDKPEGHLTRESDFEGTCVELIVKTSASTSHLARHRERLESIDLLSKLRPWVFFNKNCWPSGGTATVTIHAVGPDGEPVKHVATAAYAPARARTDARGAWVPATRDVLQLLSDADSARITSFKGADDEDSTYLDLAFVATWNEVPPGSTPDKAPLADAGENGEGKESGKREASDQSTTRKRNYAVRVIVAKDHSIATLSLVSQPGRALLGFDRCDLTAGDEPAPTSCRDAKGRWTALIGASTLGAKVFIAPSVRYPWIGMSATLGAAGFGLSRGLTTDDDVDDTPTQGFFTSLFDAQISPIDLRMPGPIRLDIGVGVGVAVVKDGSTDAWRALPTFGVNLATPLVDVFGSRFGRKKQDAVADYRAAAAVEDEVNSQLDALRKAVPDLRAKWHDTLAPLSKDERMSKLADDDDTCKAWKTFKVTFDEAEDLLSTTPFASKPSDWAVFKQLRTEAGDAFDAACTAKKDDSKAASAAAPGNGPASDAAASGEEPSSTTPSTPTPATTTDSSSPAGTSSQPTTKPPPASGKPPSNPKPFTAGGE